MPSEKTDPVVRFFVGGIAGCIAKTVVAPLDRVKILIQGKKPSYFGLSPMRILLAVYKDNGVRGLFQGNTAQLVRVFPYSAIQFLTFTIYGDLFKTLGFVTTVGVEKFVSGSLAGITACTITYPLDLIRSRIAFQDGLSKSGTIASKGSVSTNVSFDGPSIKIYKDVEHPYYRGIIHAFYNIFKYENGFAGLYKGFNPTLIGMIPYAGTSFYTFGTLKGLILNYSSMAWLVNHSQPQKHLNVYGNLLCGSVAGLMAQTIAYPLDVVRRVMQLNINKGTHHRLDGKKRTSFSVMKKIFTKYGLRNGLFRGLTINYIRVVPVVSVSFTVYETLIRKF